MISSLRVAREQLELRRGVKCSRYLRASSSVRSPSFGSRATVMTVSGTSEAGGRIPPPRASHARPARCRRRPAPAGAFRGNCCGDTNSGRGTFARHAFGGRAEQAGREALVDAAMPDHHQVGALGALADLVRDDTHFQHGLGGHPSRRAACANSSSTALPRCGQHLAHLGGEIQVGFKSERA